MRARPGLYFCVLANEGYVGVTRPLTFPTSGVDIKAVPSGFTALGREAHKTSLCGIVRSYSGFVQVDAQQHLPHGSHILAAVHPWPGGHDLMTGWECTDVTFFCFCSGIFRNRTGKGGRLVAPEMGAACPFCYNGGDQKMAPVFARLVARGSTVGSVKDAKQVSVTHSTVKPFWSEVTCGCAK